MSVQFLNARSVSNATRKLSDRSDDTFDGDSAFSGHFGSSTRHTSLKSFVSDYIYENGRRYHAFRQGEYHIPNDDREQER